MPDPYRLTGMEAAATRIADAVERRETVAIFGDYDVDGAAARRCSPSIARLRHRLPDSYPGPHHRGLRPQRGCGPLPQRAGGRPPGDGRLRTASHEPLAEARRLGLDAVVLDHHQAPENLPEALAIVNPNRQDDLSGLGHLCAAGVVFLTLVALNRELRRRGFFNEKPGRTSSPASISWRSPPSPTWCR